MDLAPYEQRIRRAATGQTMTSWARDLVLALSAVFWTRVYWVYIAPVFGIATVGQAFNGFVDFALVVMFGIAVAFVPPVLIASAVPNTPANMLLTKLQAKYSWPGLVFAIGVGGWLTYQAIGPIYSWWCSRTVVAEAGIAVQQTTITIILTYGFTAWAMTRVTPEQFEALVTQAREVQRLDAELRLEEAALKATHVRAVSLIEMDVLSLTAEQIGARNRELVTIFAAMERSRETRMRSLTRTWQSLHGITVAIHGESDEALRARYQTVERLLNDTASRHGQVLDYVESVAASAPARLTADADDLFDLRAAPPLRSRALAPQQDAETTDRERVRANAFADRSGPQRTANDGPGGDDIDRAAHVASRHLDGAWTRAQLEKALSIQKTKATQLIRVWKQRGYLRDITDPKDHYAWTLEN